MSILKVYFFYIRVGLSVYWKGARANWPWLTNTLAPATFFQQIINGGGSEGGPIAFYDIYSAGKGKPFCLSEGAAAFHVDMTSDGSSFNSIDPGPGQAPVQMSFWNGFLFNPSFLTAFPLFKMVILFEFYKPEIESMYTVDRDFRSTREPVVLNLFKSGLDSLNANGFIVWAVPFTPSFTQVVNMSQSLATYSYSSPIAVSSSIPSVYFCKLVFYFSLFLSFCL